MRYLKTELARFVRIAMGILLIAIGVPVFILPIPFGFVLIGIGIALLLGHSVASIFESIRRRKSNNPRFARFMDRLSDWSPVFVRRWLHQYGL
jgi:uncharacterized membrane protein HdeD (DUF308 family)